MADPFLEAHRIGPTEYDLSTFRPFAIRDQLVRARLLVEKAYSTVGLPHRKMLIKGAGVAGVAAAAHGATLGIRSVIIEREASVLGRFAKCSSRWVEPTHYDWPHDHWNTGSFTGLPLPFQPRTAGVLSWSWRGELSRLVQLGKTFVYTNVSDLPYSYKSETPPTVEVIPSGLPLPFNEFDLVLDCTGPGNEICDVGNYEGFRFWQTDPFGQADLGLSEGVVPRVLISGSGDGALQDFLRITTGARSAGELLVRLAGEHEAILRRHVHTAEDQARRRMVWCSTRAEKHAILMELDITYRQALDRLPGQVWKDVGARLEALILPRVRDGRIIHVAHPCNHLSPCYPLNRLLGHLVMKYLKADPKRFTFLQNSATATVSKSGHRCGSPWMRHGLDHDVTFEGTACEDPAVPPIDRGSYNVVVIRHGVARGLRKERPKDQMLPFHLPA